MSGLLNTPVEGLFYRLGGHTGDSNSTKPAATAVRRTGYTSWQWEAPAYYRSGDGFCGLLAAGQHAVNQNNGRQPRVADAEMAEAARSVLLLGHLYRTLRCVWTAAPRELRGGKRICRWAVSPGQTGRAPPGAQHPFEWGKGVPTSNLDYSLRRPQQGVGRPTPANDSYLVDSASSHMLVSKIKPCMSKYKQLYSETANGSLYKLSFI